MVKGHGRDPSLTTEDAVIDKILQPDSICIASGTHHMQNPSAVQLVSYLLIQHYRLWRRPTLYKPLL